MRSDSGRKLLLVLSFLSFVAIGLPDGLIGVAWPSIRVDFGEPIDALGALLIAATAGYVVSSVLSGVFLRWAGVGGVLAVSCALCGAALAGYTWVPTWIAMVWLGTLAGFGAGAIDAGINTYAAVNYSARRVNLLHAFYGVGAAAGPLVLTTTFAAGGTWRTGYLVVAAAEVLLAVAFVFTRGLWLARAPERLNQVEKPELRASLKDTISLRATQLSMLVFVLYVGLEAAAGAWIYSLLHDARGVEVVPAGSAVTGYWLALFAGRIVYAFVPVRSSPGNVIALCILGALLGTALLTLDLGPAPDTCAVAIMGFCAGPIFPSLIAATPARLGTAHTANAVGLQVGVSALGLAGFPALVGIVADRWALDVVPGVLLSGWVLLAALFVLLQRRSVTTRGESRHGP